MVTRAEREARGRGPVNQQFHGGAEVEFRYREDVFAVGVQRLAAGRQDVQAGARAQQVTDERGDGFDQVLAVVQDQQQVLVLQMCDQGVLFGPG